MGKWENFSLLKKKKKSLEKSDFNIIECKLTRMYPLVHLPELHRDQFYVNNVIQRRHP